MNPPQRQAVLHGSGPLLVLAGAGSGKTRVITHRIAHLITECGVAPQHIAALTFTNKAAEEMRERVRGLLKNPRHASQLTMGTFHSLGLTILREEHAALGLPRGFVIYDSADQIGVVRELFRHVTRDDGRRYDTKAVLARISLAKNSFIAPEDYKGNASDEYDEVTAQLYPQYQAALRAFGAVDFDDLITEPVRLMQTHEEVRARWQAAFRYVLVDEYQDTNRTQLMLVKQLTALHSNVCVVGDDDQSIYSWRGADPQNILRFEKDFPGAEVVVLAQNYRSTPNILSAANAVIANNKQRRGKDLWSEKSPGEAITVVDSPDAEAESEFVAQEILAVSARGKRLSDMAILYRSNLQTRELEAALRLHNIPYKLSGGQQFFERKEVKDIIAYLRVALLPSDEISLRRIINVPPRGIGHATLEKMAGRAARDRQTLWHAVSLAAAGQIDDVSTAARDSLSIFTSLIAALTMTLQSGESVVAATRQLIEQCDFYSDLRASSPSLGAAQRRIDNVEGLLRSLQSHESRKPGRAALLEYLRHLSLAHEDTAAEKNRDEVLLTTLHGSKGLEFPVVFLIGLEEELLPHARSLMPHATDVSDPDHVGDVSEERRLAYVGITRAQHILYLSRCTHRLRNGKPIPRMPSRFLCEIPEDLVKRRDIASELRAPVAQDELSDFFRQFADS